ncbi:MAG: hypothetical protein GX597_27170 [Anaerolineaceae bacterium]|nr:hypothetical protein [Anaerolineaceae bacterium]
MSHAQAQRVFAEAYLLAREYGAVEYDEEDGHWVRIERFALPAGWNSRTTEVLWELPNGYPSLPPNGFYIDRFLRTYAGRPIQHYFEERSAYNRYADRGWGWFCIHLHNEAWRPTTDVRRGDNLLKLAALVRAVLTEVVA